MPKKLIAACYSFMASCLWAYDIPPGVDAFNWRFSGTILLEASRIYYLGGTSVHGPELKDITAIADLKKAGDYFEFTYGDEKSVIIPGDTRFETISIHPECVGKWSENIYGDPKEQTESYPPGDSNLEQVITQSALIRKIQGRNFRFDSSWLLRKYFLACSCHPRAFANEVPPWIQGRVNSKQPERITIVFKKPTSGMTILNGFVDPYFPAYSEPTAG